MNETRELASFACRLKYEDLPGEVIDKTKNLILDQLGVELAGSTQSWSKAVYDLIRELGGRQESSIVNYGDRTTVENAAYANATFGHGFEADDVHRRSRSHAGAVIVPAALAMGERQRISGRDLILAVVLGYEVMGRIGNAVQPSCGNRGHHSTSVQGTFGAAAVAGKLLGFDQERMLNAISIAGSYSAGLMEFNQSGGSVKRIHPALAAQGGLRAALLAQKGLTGPPTLLEGANGFCRAFSDDYRLEAITADLGRSFIVMDVSYKRYCCCYYSHSAIDAASSLVRERRVSPGDIAEIEVGVGNTALKAVGTIKEPRDVTGSQFSAPFCIALNLVKGSNDLQHYIEKNLTQPDILDVVRKVKVGFDQEIEAIYPDKFGAKVSIRLKDGTSYQRRVDDPKGTPENPMTQEEIEAKFRALGSMVLPEERVEKIVELVSGLEKLAEVSPLCQGLIR